MDQAGAGQDGRACEEDMSMVHDSHIISVYITIILKNHTLIYLIKGPLELILEYINSSALEKMN